MADGPAHDLAGRADSVDAALLARDDVRKFLAAQDIGGLYRVLGKSGWSQYRIAKATRQSQSEVSEIISGRRQVENYQLLARIADGLGIPRDLMFPHATAGSEDGTYPDGGTIDDTAQEADEEVKRRALIAATSVAALGQAVQGLGELAELGLPTGEPLPTRLSMAHVHTVQAVTRQLVALVRQFGGQADLFAAAVAHYTRWLGVPGTEEITARLGAALAELHTEAGWACHDSGLDGRGYFARALGLADEAGDAYGIANAAWHAGATLVRSGLPDDALKCFQLGGFCLSGFQPGKPIPAALRPEDPRVPTLTTRLNLYSATAYSLMGSPEQAKRSLAIARDGWEPRDAFEHGGIDRATAEIQLDMHRLDIAEPFAASAVRTYDEAHRKSRTLAEVTLAEVHVRAGEPRGLTLARHAIDEVSALQSVRARQERLLPLADALAARPGSEARELARIARQIAVTRA